MPAPLPDIYHSYAICLKVGTNPRPYLAHHVIYPTATRAREVAVELRTNFTAMLDGIHDHWSLVVVPVAQLTPSVDQYLENPEVPLGRIKAGTVPIAEP